MSRTYTKRTDIRAEVRLRADGMCEICGVGFSHPADQAQPTAPSLHHRFRRASGGRDSVTNLLRLCRTCHTFRIHGDEETARQYGWLLDDSNAEDHPVLTRHGWIYLYEDGSWEEAPWWKIEVCLPLASAVTPGYFDLTDSEERQEVA